MEVMGGFIIGFDNDPPNIFDRQIKFIQNSGVVKAMIGLLNAPPGSRLYRRLKEEGASLGMAPEITATGHEFHSQDGS